MGYNGLCCRIDKTITENLHFIEDKNKKYYAMLLLNKVNKEII